MAIENDSFITLHRRITQWEWYTDGNTVRVFLHLILLANHKETRWRGEVIGRGQVLTGLDQLSREFRVITINNYSVYQDKKERKQQANQQTDQQADNKQVTASNNVNNDNNKNKTSSIECVKRSAFTAPTKQETASFFEANGSTIDEASKYWYHYDANGWMVGKVKMKSWTSAAKKWIANSKTIYLNGNGSTAKRNGTLVNQQPISLESLPRIMQSIANDDRYA